MKTRFNTYDIVCMVTELQRLIGMRVNQVYDIDNKSYLIRLQRSEEKSVLLLESGNRFHTTQFEWPKNASPSGFTMKLRKHLKNKRLESLTQLGIDRVVDLQFGSGEAAYHVILELYDRGNIILTDYELNILNVLRPHVEGDKIRFAVKEKYPLDRAKTTCEPPLGDALKEILAKSKPGDNLKKILNPNVEYGPAIIDHVLLENGLSGNLKVGKGGEKAFQLERDLDKLEAALRQADGLLQRARTEVAKGFVIQKKELRPGPEGSEGYLLANVEFHPLLFAQHREAPHADHDSFDRACDEFYSAVEGQKIDLKTIQVEREAMKKLSNVKRDHERRLSELERVQQGDRDKAELIARNQTLVDQARLAIQTGLANQMSWDDIKLLVKTAQENQDPIASTIKSLRLDINHITLQLTDPYEGGGSDGGDGGAEGDEGRALKPMMIDIDLSLTAFANARKYYDQKRNAAKKQQKTLDAQGKAFKSAERKTKQTLKEAHTISSISKARKTYWFEKFFWFISSDNYLVIGGRDQQQNELLVKRHLRAGDVYVHADVSGAASVIVKRAGSAPPPKTLLEAGHAAVAYSVAWEAKVLTSAWWVRAHQVSKSAPTGEFLSTGSFMIRGRKNFLLPQQLQLGFGFMFRLEDSCIERHKDDRRPIQPDDVSEATSVQESEDNEQEIVVSDGDDDETSDKEAKPADKDSPLATIAEETTRIEIRNGESESPAEDKDGEKSESTPVEKETETDNESDSDGGFPDTHIKVDHGTGKVIIESKTRTISEMSDSANHLDDDAPLTFPPLPKKGGKKPQKEKKPNKQEKEEQKQKEREKETVKRGQRGKLKKIREKYRNQDEEERALKLELLQSANSAKDSKKSLKKNAPGAKPRGPKPVKIPQAAPQMLEADSDVEDPGPDAETEVAEVAEAVDAEAELLLQLTGQPVAEDELLFAVPVVAPYSSLHNYKFKVKLTPGTSKRGKAAKTAIQVFLKDPACSQREKDLLKAVKEEDVARNFPGKVKLSAPNLHRKKK